MVEERKSRVWHWVVVGLIVAGVAGLVIFRGRPIGNGIDRGSADPQHLLALKNDAVALMENWQFDLATQKLTELEQLVPNEPLVRRNRAIAAVLAVSPEAIDKMREREAYERGYARAVEAVEKLLADEPELPIAHLLAARLAEHREQHAKVVEHLERAATLSHGDPAFEAEVYLASRLGQDSTLEARGVAALQRAAKAKPDNLWVLSELVVAQVNGKDPATNDTLARLRELSQPFVEFIQQHYRVNLRELLDKASSAVEQQDWGTATRHVRVISNLLRPEIATKLDLRKVVKHPLEYVLSDFSPEWHKQHVDTAKKSGVVAAAPIEVTFTEADTADQLPPLAGIRDVKIADFDLDGRWDVIVLLNGQVIVFGQTGDPKSRWTTLCEAVVPNGLTKLVAVDLDRDTEETPEGHKFIGQRTAPSGEQKVETIGAAELVEDADIDLLVYGEEGVVFLRNEYDAATKARSLKALPQEPNFEALRNVLAMAPADIDHDGDLDLVVSTAAGMSIWQNNDSREHTKFADISSRSALPPSDLKATVLLPVDWNFDVQTDVLVTGPEVKKPGWLENISHGRLRWHDGDAADPKNPVVEKGNAAYLMWLNTKGPSWELRGFGEAVFGRLGDFDNDGHRDALSWDAEKVSCELSSASPNKPVILPTAALGKTAQCEVADFDSDGDEDVLVVTDQRPIWIRNDGGNKNGWLDVSIRADKDRKPQRDAERANIHGIGSWLELRGTELPELPGRKSHVRIVEGQSTHFGLGSAKHVDAARIVWTNGVPQNILHPKSGQAIAAQQFLKGSCPYLYTWDGEQWAFYTDCLWAAPIGLQLAEGVTAPCREWEYLKIDGDRLRETNGEYRLMLTEELWEAAYFDQVRLLAVDHPADVDFFSNEKVGPPSISEFKLHPVRKRHTPVAARDHHGRDVLDKIARRDERYLRAFDKIIQQGLTEEHFIELDLGDLGDAKNVTLFLTGWIFPTDTSINVSLSQNPDRDGPKPPSIWVPIESPLPPGEGGRRPGEGSASERLPKTGPTADDVNSNLAPSPQPSPKGRGSQKPGEGSASERLPKTGPTADDVNSNLAPSPQPSPKGRGSQKPGEGSASERLPKTGPTDDDVNSNLVPSPQPSPKGRGSDQLQWREAIPYIGFPGGKTKTIAVDLSEVLDLIRTPLPPGEGGRRPGEGSASERLPKTGPTDDDVNSNLAPSLQPSPKGRGGQRPGEGSASERLPKKGPSADDVNSNLAPSPQPSPKGRGSQKPGEGSASERLPKTGPSADDVNSNLAPSPQPSPKGRGGRTTRLRIVTSMELYWDEMFFTVDEPPLEHTLTELPLVSADLQYRGFSARLPHPEFGPERYDATQITIDPQWPPMGGKFTRYGDVTELLTESDDRLAILGAGDAVTIRFDATKAPKLPAGWKRDFIIHNVGYDKDADLNTIYGQFVEPLPFRAMRGYPDATGVEFPDLPIHRADQRRFQTREQNRRTFWLGR